MIDLVRSLSAILGTPIRRRPSVQGFWYGKPLAPLHWACLNSFLEKGLGFELYAYQELAVPPGVQLRDAAEILPREDMFFFPNPHTGQPDVAPFVDYFRLLVLYNQGGWWCDVDTICLSADLPSGERAWARQSPEYRHESVSNGQLYFEKGDELLVTLIEEARILKDKIPRRESLGPELLTSVVKRLGLPLDMGGTADTFYPIRFIENFKLWLPEFADEIQLRTKGAVFLPIYQSFPARLGFTNDKLPPKGSYLRKFLRIHAPEFDGQHHGAEEFRSAVRHWFQTNPKFIPILQSVCQSDIKVWLETGSLEGRKKSGKGVPRKTRGNRSDGVAS